MLQHSLGSGGTCITHVVRGRAAAAKTRGQVEKEQGKLLFLTPFLHRGMRQALCLLSHSCSGCPHVRTLILEPLERRDYERETPEQWRLCCELNTNESSTALPSWGRRRSKLPPLMAGSASQGYCGLTAGHASRAAPGTAGSRQRR